jgi:hypothetical protein
MTLYLPISHFLGTHFSKEWVSSRYPYTNLHYKFYKCAIYDNAYINGLYLHSLGSSSSSSVGPGG